jgi:hypothetical protein
MTKQIPINVPFQTRRKPGRPKRILENVNTAPALKLPRKIGKEKITENIKEIITGHFVNEKRNEMNTEKNNEKRAPEPTTNTLNTLPFKARYKARNTIPISELLNSSTFNDVPDDIISEGETDTEKMEKERNILNAQKQHVKEQTDNLNYISIKMGDLNKENCYLKKLEILNGLIPRAKNIAHIETRLLKTIPILENILKYIQFINGRDITAISGDIKQKIEKLKAEQFAIEDARQKAYQKSVETILEKLNVNLEGI